MLIAVENEPGSIRRGIDPSGKPWSILMRNAYGYLRRTEGVDGDHVDCYLGPDLDGAETVYVVHQRKAGHWKEYDEDKAMIGFPSRREAVRAFLRHYDDRRFLGPVTAMPVDEFVEKAKATFERPAMIKARGWWGPFHGGTPKNKGPLQKGGAFVVPGSPNPADGLHIPRCLGPHSGGLAPHRCHQVALGSGRASSAEADGY